MKYLLSSHHQEAPLDKPSRALPLCKSHFEGGQSQSCSHRGPIQSGVGLLSFFSFFLFFARSPAHANPLCSAAVGVCSAFHFHFKDCSLARSLACCLAGSLARSPLQTHGSGGGGGSTAVVSLHMFVRADRQRRDQFDLRLRRHIPHPLPITPPPHRQEAAARQKLTAGRAG